MTEAGYRTLEEELARLKKKDRPEVIEAIAAARKHGDLSENAEYHAAKEKQVFLEKRISDLEGRLAHASVIEIKEQVRDTIAFGATVALEEKNTGRGVSYQLVGETEANLTEGRLSISSPLAKSLLGKRSGDAVTVETPGGLRGYKIKSVVYDVGED
jgi:transcription elongation factor GreA